MPIISDKVFRPEGQKEKREAKLSPKNEKKSPKMSGIKIENPPEIEVMDKNILLKSKVS